MTPLPSKLPTLDDLLRLVGLQLGARVVRPADRLVEDLAAESADLVNLLAALEETYGLALDETHLAGVHTVADLHALVTAASASAKP
jgi:acyl carrier protein